MMTANLWFFHAVIAAVLWGITYAVAGRLLQAGFSIPALLICELFLAMPIFLAMTLFKGNIQHDIALVSANPRLLYLLLVLAASFAAANFMIATSIYGKNATLAALVEISYPIFTFAFIWLVFGETQLTWHTAIGATLIFLGIGVIYLKG